MRIAIFGSGAVGTFFGGKLAQAGEDVVFIARGAHQRALRERGLRVESADGDFTLGPLHATDDPTTVAPVDVVLLAVKGWQAPEAIRAMAPLIGAETFIVPLLNGIDIVDQLADAFGARRVVGGLCLLFGSLVEPGRVRNALPTPSVTIGELDDMRSERAERLCAAFERAGVRASIAPHILAALWEKLLFVETLGSVGAVTRAPVGILRTLPQTRALLEQALRETQAVARGRGVALEDTALDRVTATIESLPEGATTSMQRDIIAGRPSELESQTGAIVRLGQRAGVDVPLHTMLYASLLPLELRARGDVQFAL